MTQDFLDQVERQLVEATERGAKRRRFWHGRLPLRLPTFAVAVAAVTAVTATALAAELALPAGHAKHRATRTVAARPAAPVSAAGFQPQSFTAIGEFTWWLLGTKPCGGATCLAIARTEDGGRSFVWLPTPTPIDAQNVQAQNFQSAEHGQNGKGVEQLRFADAQDGYAFEPQLWSTHDGGSTWQQVKLGGQVTELMASGAYVYAIVLPPRGGPGKLMRSPVASDNWTTLTAATDLQSSLWVHDADVLVESFGGQGGSELLISSDYGATFTAYKAPPSVQCSFEWAPPTVIWEPCATGTMGGIWRSTDDGATYSPVGGDATAGRMELDNSAAFAAATSDTAVVGSQRLYRTVDGGNTWQPVPGPAVASAKNPDGLDQWTYLGFTDTTHGVGIGLFGSGGSDVSRLYYTINAGASYHYVPINPT
jgi:hypothetical protein